MARPWWWRGHIRLETTDAALHVLTKAKEIDSLSLAGPGVTDAGLRFLRELTALRRLVLVQTSIRDDGYAWLGTLAQLQSLHIGDVPVTDEHLSHFQSLNALQGALTPKHASAGLRPTASERTSTSSSISAMEQTALDETHLDALAQLRSLVGLSFLESDISDRGLKHLSAYNQPRGA